MFKNIFFKDVTKNLVYLLGGPLEASNTRILDFIQVLGSLGAVNHDVGAVGVRAEAPDLSEYYFNLNTFQYINKS